MKDIKADKSKIKFYLIMNSIKAFIFLIIPFIVLFSFLNILKGDLILFLVLMSTALLFINISFIFISFYSIHLETKYEISVFKKEFVLKNIKTNIKYNVPYDDIDKFVVFYNKTKIKRIKIKIKRIEYDIRLFDDDTINEIVKNIKAAKRNEKY